VDESRIRDKPMADLSDQEVLTFLLGAEQAQQAMEISLWDIHKLFIEEVEQKLSTDAAIKLKAAAEFGRRIATKSRKERPEIMTPEDAILLIMEDMRYLEKEHFKALLLDVRNKVIALETISVGTLDTGLVHPREALGPALRKSAAYVVFAHNHPSGNPEPSQADIDMTARLAVAGEVLGIEVMDHIVIGDGTYVSFREQKIAGLW
jgi:DNA repair protein RadC